MEHVEIFYEKDSSTLSYLVFDPESKDAIIIDPVMNYEPSGSTYWCDSIEQIVNFVTDKQLTLHLSIDTHAHADHLTATAELKKRFPKLRSVIGKSITQVQQFFASHLELPKLATDGSQFDLLVEDGQTITAGRIKVNVIHTPGHTPTCTCYHINDMVFSGDALFMPDIGTGRCDFPDGCAKMLYQSIMHKLYTLPDQTRVFVGHDYQPNGRDLAWETTIKDSKAHNKHIKATTTEEEFITFRTKRDKTLRPPRLLLPSIQVNIAGGISVDTTAPRFLKIPITLQAK